MKFSCLLATLVVPALVFSQEVTDTIQSTGNYQATVRAYEQYRAIGDVPAAINYVSRNDLNRFSNTSIVPALNATAGVRMEERSPGSYRLNIRGSSLRSPFGVRNVKVYYNDIPFTDPGGHTYLNQLGFYNIQSLEVIKGPGSSLYGAGTGGVMLINNDASLRQAGVIVDQVVGSFGTSNTNININFGSDRHRSMVNYQHQQSDGYRQHSAMRRDVLSWEATSHLSAKDKLTATFLYGDLFYQTPGALTRAEYEANPAMARPAVGFIPGSADVGASIRQRTFLAGASYRHLFNERWQSTTSLYGAFTGLENPTIRNYGRANEPHVGGRSSVTYSNTFGVTKLSWQAGAELQQGFTTIRIYDNRGGRPDTLRSDDEINNLAYFLFSQLNLEHNRWNFSLGASYNQQQLRLIHLTPLPYRQSNINFNNKLAPRLAVLYKIKPTVSLYTSLSRGFSPPTTAELYPTGSISNPNLQAEEGWNYDIGLKGNVYSPRLFVDVNAFYFRLQNTIVQRRDAAGGDYFENAGSTRQRGLEAQAWYQLFPRSATFAPSRLWMNYTYYHFRYKDFKQVTNDFSGNRLPGVAPHTVGAGADISLKKGFYTNLTYQFVDDIPLNDANSAIAESFHLLTARFGFRRSIEGRYTIDVFAGGDNLLNMRYSLGNDINGFGGRFFNAAPARNYFAGVSVGVLKRQQ
ncbi:TonB-dependent receptor [Aridibaculum aurantiacum]|uniref:TonB-dependent receptor n=1 Tax=Aridibaculum aurantiacum TaxID=2810307 RepID=UPI001A96095B|nr:TonB-dependent receptor [Aridibaculum aurantiacum]